MTKEELIKKGTCANIFPGLPGVQMNDRGKIVISLYVITRYSARFIFQTYERNRSGLLVFTDKEEADKCYKELYDLLQKLQHLEMSADEYRDLKGIKEERLTSWQYSDFINTNEAIIENILELDDQFEPIKEYVKFYEDSEATHRLEDHFYTDINIGFHVEKVDLRS